jgi:hypothetical protein
VIGVLGAQSADVSYEIFTVPFLQGLKETGFVDGQNVAFAQAMKEKLRPYPSGGAVEAVARGEADLVVIGISPILDVPGVELIGWLPPELQSYIGSLEDKSMAHEPF